MTMSSRATLIDPITDTADDVTAASFIGHMKSVIEKSKNNNRLKSSGFRKINEINSLF